MRICKVCKKEKEDLYFRVIDHNNMTYKTMCRECEKAYSRKMNHIRNPLKKSKDIPEEVKLKREQYRQYKQKYKKLWHMELYNYIKDKNIFNDNELKDILNWLKAVDILGGRVRNLK